MSANVVRLPSALRDLNTAAEYIQATSGPERAIRFLRSADATFSRLARMPGMGTLYEPSEPIYANLRFFAIDRHRNHLVFYRPIPGGIEVFRVLHGARDIHGLLSGEFNVGDDDDPAYV